MNPWNILSFKKTDSGLWRDELQFSLVDSLVSSVECVLRSNIWVIFSKILFYLKWCLLCVFFFFFSWYLVIIELWIQIHLWRLFATKKNLIITTFQSYLCINNAVFLCPLLFSSSIRMSYRKWNKGKRSYQVQRMWLQNNVQEKDKKMYPFTSALQCIWEAVDGDKGKQNIRETE